MLAIYELSSGHSFHTYVYVVYTMECTVYEIIYILYTYIYTFIYIYRDIIKAYVVRGQTFKEPQKMNMSAD